MKVWTFDDVFLWVCQKIPVVGAKIEKYYLEHGLFQRLIKYATSTSLIFWMFKGPLIWVLTDLLNVWYVLSAFVVGVIVTLICFVLGEFWVWKRKTRKEVM